ncbi:MAG: 16S rRNA (guanine(527)-N(7))-methyltransferase RsmG [Lachnospiraceae bacterium]|nr:16S rRNA (guanine(527)-N(7))-methyltransferase RsmG [Lachnospiraceae bacterium]
MERFISACKELDIELTKEQVLAFQSYYDLLIRWNERMNLTSITEFEEVCNKHFLDSLSLVKVLSIHSLKGQKLSLLDVGTGAGFPGIPLKICFPNLQVTLLDSLNKRLTFLNEVIETLCLKDIVTVHGRAEDFGKDKAYREQFDLCVSRAVANLSSLSELCLPFVKVAGSFISYKAEKGAEELEAAGKAISLCGGTVLETKEFMLPGTDYYRFMICIKKTKATPMSYPRKAGLPTKEPLC